MSKLTIVEGNSNDKDYTRVIMVKGEKGDPGDVNTAQLNDVQMQINKLASGSPLVASSTSEMTDTSKIYVNTTDGKWYYYNGEEWTIGGTYQSTGIDSGAITQLNLDNYLKENIKTKVPVTNFTNGYYRNANGGLSSSANGYYSEPIQLKRNETLYIKAKGNTTMTMITKVNSDNSIFINSSHGAVVHGDSTSIKGYKYTANEDCYVCISYLNEIEYYYISYIDENKLLLFELDKISNITHINDSNIMNNKGYYINKIDENIASNSQYFYSNPILLNSGDEIFIKCYGTTSVSILTQCDSSGNNRTSILSPSQTGIAEYHYTADDSIYVIVSAALYDFEYCFILKNKEDLFSIKKNLLDCFLKVGCIGDSLASGESSYKDNGVSKLIDLYDYSWGQYLARMTGNTYYNFSKGGLTAKTWLSDPKGASLAFDGNHECEAYIIGLGVNDRNSGSEYIGESSDINLSDYTQNADTFYGNYGKIIQMIKENQPKAKIFVFNIPLSDENSLLYNQAIEYMPTIFDDVYLIDLYENINIFTKGFLQAQKRNGHYNATGYKFIAEVFYSLINEFMSTNESEFRQIEFIGTDYEWN